MLPQRHEDRGAALLREPIAILSATLFSGLSVDAHGPTVVLEHDAIGPTHGLEVIDCHQTAIRLVEGPLERVLAGGEVADRHVGAAEAPDAPTLRVQFVLAAGVGQRLAVGAEDQGEHPAGPSPEGRPLLAGLDVPELRNAAFRAREHPRAVWCQC